MRTGNITENFTYEEMLRSTTATQRKIDNTPTDDSTWNNIEYLVKTCLQPVRTHFGRPVTISSGYRSPALNKAVGGSSSSFHLYGCAADITVKNTSDKEVFQYIAENLPFTELIAENIPTGWVHVAIMKGRDDEKATKYLKRGGSVKRGSVEEILALY